MNGLGKLKIFCLSFIFLISSIPVANATSSSFDQWVQKFQIKALENGVSQNTLNAAFDGLSVNDRVVELDGKQPEKTITFVDYRKRILSDTRIKKGREMLIKHRDILERVSKDYGVQPEYIVALWGVETSFGGYTGNFSTVRSLATLAYDGRRASFFEKELLNALQIIEAGHISASEMTGSWAGALGQNQFMPSSFLAYAQDYNGNGRKNIWTELEDVFASSANYLSQSGWHGDELWGRQVLIPDSVREEMIGRENKKTLQEWSNIGVTKLNGEPLPNVEGMKGGLVAPDGIDGPVYLVYNNYDVLMKWNRSTYFATSVGLLANRIK